jgi:hypothetical protein
MALMAYAIDGRVRLLGVKEGQARPVGPVPGEISNGN